MGKRLCWIIYFQFIISKWKFHFISLFFVLWIRSIDYWMKLNLLPVTLLQLHIFEKVSNSETVCFISVIVVLIHELAEQTDNSSELHFPKKWNRLQLTGAREKNEYIYMHLIKNKKRNHFNVVWNTLQYLRGWRNSDIFTATVLKISKHFKTFAPKMHV